MSARSVQHSLQHMYTCVPLLSCSVSMPAGSLYSAYGCLLTWSTLGLTEWFSRGTQGVRGTNAVQVWPCCIYKNDSKFILNWGLILSHFSRNYFCFVYSFPVIINVRPLKDYCSSGCFLDHSWSVNLHLWEEASDDKFLKGLFILQTGITPETWCLSHIYVKS